MFNFKKETTREKIINGAKETASTIGAIGLATAYFAAAGAVEAANIQNERNRRSSGYNSSVTDSGYHKSYKSSVMDSITRDYMKDFMHSFGSCDPSYDRRIANSGMYQDFGESTYHNYAVSGAKFHVACAGYDWKLFTTYRMGVLYMVLTNKYDGIIAVASSKGCYIDMKFREEARNNYKVNSIYDAVRESL